MSRANQKYGVRKTTSTTWWFLCVCFMLASVTMPAYAVQKLNFEVTMFSSPPAADKAMLTADIHSEGMHSEDLHSAMNHHAADNQTHHSQGHSNVHCDDSECTSMLDCADSCSMSTCCSSPGVSHAFTNGVLTEHHGKTVHRDTDGSSILSVRSEPLFRPPIH